MSASVSDLSITGTLLSMLADTAHFGVLTLILLHYYQDWPDMSKLACKPVLILLNMAKLTNIGPLVLVILVILVLPGVGILASLAKSG